MPKQHGFYSLLSCRIVDMLGYICYDKNIGTMTKNAQLGEICETR